MGLYALSGKADADIESIARFTIKQDAESTEEAIELVHGTSNIFRDFDCPDADREQLRAILAAGILGVLEDRKLTSARHRT